MVIASNNRYYIPQHLQVLDSYLTDVGEGKLKRLIITMPPRHGKTLLTSTYFPVWYLGHHPDKRVILTSYGSGLAYDPSMAARDIFKDWAGVVFNGLKLNPYRAQSMDWGIYGHTGGMFAAGLQGSLTGKGASLLIIDDPIKGNIEAQSPTIRENVWNWYSSVAYARLEPEGAIVLIQTRWHMDDLAGKLIKEMEQGGEEWTILNLPAIAEQDEEIKFHDAIGNETRVFRRKKGEPLWPARFDIERLNIIKRVEGDYWFASLYQQRPVPLEGGIFKEEWIQYYEDKDLPNIEDFDVVIQSWDPTVSKSFRSDYVVGQVWGRKGADFYLLDQIRGRYDFDETVFRIRELSRAYPQSNAKIIEAQAIGSALCSHLKHEIEGLIPIPARESKELRALNVTPLFQAHNVYIPRPNDTKYAWVHDYVQELINFPNGANDDQVDATSQALNQIKGTLFAKTKRCLVDSPDAIIKHDEYYILSWIPARLTDYSIVLVYKQSTNAVVHFERINAEPLVDQIQRVYELCNLYEQAPIRVIGGYDEALLATLENKGVYVDRVQLTKKEWASAYENLALLINNGLISYPDYPELIAELEVFKSDYTFDGTPDYTLQIAQDAAVRALCIVTFEINPQEIIMADDVYYSYDTEAGLL
jgi:predicted phage terminase large subunit-like protein